MRFHIPIDTGLEAEGIVMHGRRPDQDSVDVRSDVGSDLSGEPATRWWKWR